MGTLTSSLPDFPLAVCWTEYSTSSALQRPGAALHVPGLVQKCDTQYIQNSFLTLVIDFSCLNFAHLVESKSSKQTEERMYVSTQQGADP